MTAKAKFSLLDDEDTFLSAMKMKVVRTVGYMASNALRAKWVWYDKGKPPTDTGPIEVVTAYTDGEVIAFCRDYFRGLDFEKSWRVAAHEVAHYSLAHPERMKVLIEKDGHQFDPVAAMLAADDRTNRMLKKLSSFPPDGFIAPDDVVNDDMTFEQVYHTIKRGRKTGKMGGGGKGKPQQGKPGQGQPGHEGHDHSKWAPCGGVIPSKQEMDQAKADMSRKSSNLKAAIEDMKSRGLLPGNSQYEVEIELPKRSWDELLSEAVASGLTNEDYSMRRWNRVAFGQLGTLSGSMWSEERKCVFATDTSGSMSEEDLRKAMGIVGSITGEVLSIQFDHSIQDVVRVKRGEWDGVRRISGRGGTAYKPVFDYIKKITNEGEDVPVLVIFTDGYGDGPTRSDYPTDVVWLCTTATHPASDRSGKFIRFED